MPLLAAHKVHNTSSLHMVSITPSGISFEAVHKLTWAAYVCILQERQLYYDHEGGTYYEYDTETGQYQVHSRVKLPKKTAQSEDGLEKVVDLCSSSDSEGEGETRFNE